MNGRPHLRRMRRVARYGALASLLLVIAPMVSRADAVTTIVAPDGAPYHVPVDAQGRPVPFTIAVTGFPAGSLVYVEQCDAQPTSAPNWAPSRDCDIGTSPAPVIADAGGRARFAAGDRNHSFQPFVGLGPEGLFSCLTPGAAALNNGLPEYRSCQIRVSSSNTQSTTDQVLLSIVFGNASASHSGSSPRATTAVAFVVALAVVGTGLAFARRRRRATGAV